MTTDKSSADALTDERIEAEANLYRLDLANGIDWCFDDSGLKALVRSLISESVEQHEAAPAVRERSAGISEVILSTIVRAARKGNSYVEGYGRAQQFLKDAGLLVDPRAEAQPEQPAADERAAFVKLIGYDRPETEGVAREAWDSQRGAWLEALDYARASSPNAAGVEQALGYAQRLATSLWEKHWRDSAPQWKVLDDTLGVLTQIDNMVCELSRAPRTDVAGGVEDAAAWVNANIDVPGDEREVIVFLNGDCALCDWDGRKGGGWGIRLAYFDHDKNYWRVHGSRENFVTHWQDLPDAPVITSDAESPSADAAAAAADEPTIPAELHPNTAKLVRRFARALANKLLSAQRKYGYSNNWTTDDELWDQTLRERDNYQEWADKLANAIAAHLNVDIGEHSNVNNPWREALEAIENASPASAPFGLTDEQRSVITQAADYLGHDQDAFALAFDLRALLKGDKQ